MKCMFHHKDCNCLEENIICPHASDSKHVITVINYMLEVAGLPTYALLQRSCEEATKFVLSLTKEPRTGCSHGLHPDTCEDCKRTVAGMQSCCPFHYVQDSASSKTALTLLRPAATETISQWAERYVRTMLSE